MKDIPYSERPRERMLEVGVSSLSNEELLSIIFRCGTKGKSVKELSCDVLNEIKEMSNFKEVTFSRISSIKGIGVSKATTILAVVEFGRRIFLDEKNKTLIIYNNPSVIFDNTKYLFDGKKQECFYCFYFNNKQHLIGKELLFVGTVNKSIVHPREIFKYAYLYSASSIVCIHNHPSGDVTPSKEDIEITKALVQIGNVQKIPILDHIIIGDNNYYSFSDNGQINNR
jgi:DNA repair protein RadC